MDEKSWPAHLQYAAIALSMLGLGYVFAHLVPFFDEMLGLIGGLLAGPISFLFPIVFFIGAYKLRHSQDDVASSIARSEEAPDAQPVYAVALKHSEWLRDSE